MQTPEINYSSPKNVIMLIFIYCEIACMSIHKRCTNFSGSNRYLEPCNYNYDTSPGCTVLRADKHLRAINCDTLTSSSVLRVHIYISYPEMVHT